MSSSNSRRFAVDRAWGFGHRLKSSGVTRLTAASVVRAESDTLTMSSNGLWKFSGRRQGEYSSLRILRIMSSCSESVFSVSLGATRLLLTKVFYGLITYSRKTQYALRAAMESRAFGEK